MTKISLDQMVFGIKMAIDSTKNSLERVMDSFFLVLFFSKDVKLLIWNVLCFTLYIQKTMPLKLREMGYKRHGSRLTNQVLEKIGMYFHFPLTLMGTKVIFFFK